MSPCVQCNSLFEGLRARGDDDGIVFAPRIHARHGKMQFECLQIEIVQVWIEIISPLVAQASLALARVDQNVLEARRSYGAILNSQFSCCFNGGRGEASRFIRFHRFVELDQLLTKGGGLLLFPRRFNRCAGAAHQGKDIEQVHNEI